MSNYKKRMTDSNIKVKAWLFSMPPVKSCLNHKTCASSCYAKKAYKQYTNTVKPLWDQNFSDAKSDLFKLYDDLDVQCAAISKQQKHKRVVRIHQSGDFINQDYVNMWHDIAAKYPTILFYAYTKVDHILDITYLNSLDNVNIIPSLINGQINYGTEDYIQGLNKDHGTFICPASYGKNKDQVLCGIESRYSIKAGATMCDHCFKKDNVAFLQH